MGTVNFWKCTFLFVFVCQLLFGFSGLNLKVLFTTLFIRWNLHSEIGLSEKKKKIKFWHDSKITVQVFNNLSSKFAQIINNLTEGTGELAFPKRWKRLYLFVILLIMLLLYNLNEPNSNFFVEFPYECF